MPVNKKQNQELILLIGDTEVIIDWAGRQHRCNYCGVFIRFACTVKNNKYIPISQFGQDWQVHWDDCIKGREDYRKKAEAKFNENALNNF